MVTFWNHHPYVSVVIIVLILTALTISRFRQWITTGEFLSLLLEVVIVVMIGVELGEGTEQTKILSDLSKSTAATAEQQEKSLGSLQQMNDKLRDSITQTGEMAGAVQKQLDILREEQQARLRHPILQVRAVLYNHAVSTQVLEPLTRKITGMNLILESDGGRLAEFVLRNIGTAEATNVEIRPQIPPGTKVCIEYSGFAGSMPPFPSPSNPCVPSGHVAVTILPRPKNRPELSVQGKFSPDFDDMFDVGVRIHLDIPKATSLYTLVFTVNADGLPPTGYAVQCHNPLP